MNGADLTMPNYCALAAAILTDNDAQAALRMMELVPPREIPKVTDRKTRNAEIVRRYQDGETAGEISDNMNVHRQTVYNVLAAAGVPLRKREGKLK